MKIFNFYLLLVLQPFFLFAQTLDEPFASVEPMVLVAQNIVSVDNERPDFKLFEQQFDRSKNIDVTILPFDLNSLMESRNRMFIIDSREKQEYDISHVKAAKWVGYNDFGFERIWMLDRNTTIIVYCTDGTRSSVIAGFMRLVGFVDVRIINGGLIEWVNEGYNIYDISGAVINQVFVQTPKEGRQLKKATPFYNK